MADHPHCLKRSAPRLELFQLEKEMHGCSWVVVGVGVVPNKTLKGFDKIGQTKEALESVCTKCVSCADIHVVATGDGIVLADGPLYPLFTGRRDSTRSYHDEAMAEILKPDDEITLTIDLFSLSGFKDEKLSSLPGMYTQAPPFSYQVYVIITTLMKATICQTWAAVFDIRNEGNFVDWLIEVTYSDFGWKPVM
ncbi:hypothetical protein ACFX1X_003684 [Malus domestica]